MKSTLRNLFTWGKEKFINLDGHLIDIIGHPILFTGNVFENEKKNLYVPTTVIGYYEYKEQISTAFGVDELDEIAIEFNVQTLYQKLGRIPKISEIISVEGANWKIINRKYKYKDFLGKYRIILICTIFLGGNDVEKL